VATAQRKQVGGVAKFDLPNFNEIGSHIQPPDDQISSKSNDFLFKCGHLTMFEAATVRHLKLKKFTFRHVTDIEFQISRCKFHQIWFTLSAFTRP